MIRSLNELLQTLYGVRTSFIENPETALVGTSAVMFLNNNPRRLNAQFINLSANAIYVSPNTEVSATRGIWVAPNGGVFSLNYLDDLELTCISWYAISAAVGCAVYTIETVMI